MKTRSKPHDTRERLLNEAERLFARRGIASTSVRDIVGAARANLGAITYHFGTKDTLVREVIERRLRPLNAERLSLLDAAEAGNGSRAPVEAILRAFVEPTIRLWRENPGFMQVMARLQAEPRSKLVAHFEELFRRYTAALGRSLPDLPAAEIAWRMSFVVGSMVHTWIRAKHLCAISKGMMQYDDEEAIVDRLVRFGAAGLRAPLRTTRAGRSRTKGRS